MPQAPRYLTRFRCIAEKCPDTCCASTHIPISRKEHAVLSLRLPAAEVAEHVAISPIPRRFVEYASLKRQEDGRCSFLREDALCSIQARYGEVALPNTCAAFPRLLLQGPTGAELSASLACPEIARLVMERDDALEVEEVNHEGLHLTWAQTAAGMPGSGEEEPFAARVSGLLAEARPFAETLRRIQEVAGPAQPSSIDPSAMFERLIELRLRHPASERFRRFATERAVSDTERAVSDTETGVSSGETGGIAEREAAILRVARHAWPAIRLQRADAASRALQLALRTGLVWYALSRSAASPTELVQLCARYLEKHPVFLDVFGDRLRDPPEQKLGTVRAIADWLTSPPHH